MFKKFAFMVAVAGLSLSVCPLMAQSPVGASGGRGRGGARPNGFPQYTRPLASQDVLARGKSLYDANCASCHAADLRGVLAKNGPNLLRSTETFSDQQGEKIAASLEKHRPPVNLPMTDVLAIDDYIHSVQSTMGAQGSPPGRNPVGLTYNVLVGDPKAGQATFTRLCSSCHSVTGDLKGIGAKYDDPKTLQNNWVSGTGGAGGGRGGRGGGGGGQDGVVTLANGEKLEGRILRRDDFLVIVLLPDGTRRSIARDNGVPKVEVKDPQEAHKKMMLQLDDPDNKNMHDITAYLATIK